MHKYSHELDAFLIISPLFTDLKKLDLINTAHSQSWRKTLLANLKSAVQTDYASASHKGFCGIIIHRDVDQKFLRNQFAGGVYCHKGRPSNSLTCAHCYTVHRAGGDKSDPEAWCRL